MAGFLEKNRLLRAALDAMPVPVFVVDRSFVLLDANRAGHAFLGSAAEQPLRTIAGEALHCINALAAGGGCGTSEACGRCVLRAAVVEAATLQRPVRRRWTLARAEGQASRKLHLFVTAAELPEAGLPLSLLILEDFTEFAEMRGLLPVCSGCRRIRDDQDYWEHNERYLDQDAGLGVAQGLCPECLEKHFPGTGSSH